VESSQADIGLLLDRSNLPMSEVTHNNRTVEKKVKIINRKLVEPRINPPCAVGWKPKL
jgi:hypothetical protein